MSGYYEELGVDEETDKNTVPVEQAQSPKETFVQEPYITEMDVLTHYQNVRRSKRANSGILPCRHGF